MKMKMVGLVFGALLAMTALPASAEPGVCDGRQQRVRQCLRDGSRMGAGPAVSGRRQNFRAFGYCPFGWQRGTGALCPCGGLQMRLRDGSCLAR